jgi:hypothetical protein
LQGRWNAVGAVSAAELRVKTRPAECFAQDGEARRSNGVAVAHKQLRCNCRP